MNKSGKYTEDNLDDQAVVLCLLILNLMYEVDNVSYEIYQRDISDMQHPSIKGDRGGSIQ